MNDIFWLKVGELAGSAGPNRVIWSIQALREANIGRVLSVNDGDMIRLEDLKKASIDYKCLPLSKNAPPHQGDLEYCLDVLPRALDFVLAPRLQQTATLVHCSSGKDRTGLFMCYYLCMIENYGPTQAISKVKEVRPIALTATGWTDFANSVLEQAIIQR